MSDNKKDSSDSSSNDYSSNESSNESIKKYEMNDMGPILKTYGTIAEELELRYNESKEKIEILKKKYKNVKSDNKEEKSKLKIEYNNENMNMDSSKLKMKKLLKQVFDSVKNAHNELK